MLKLNPLEELLTSIVLINPTAKELSKIDNLIPKIENWDYAIMLIVNHGSAPLFFTKFHDLKNINLIPINFQLKIKQVYYRTISRSIYIHGLLKKICEALVFENIKVVVLKGAYLSQFLYSDVGLRQLSDIDILVKPEDGEKTVSIIQKIGFISHDSSVSDFISSQSETVHYPPLVFNGIGVDVHIRLHRKSNNYNIITSEFINNSIDYSIENTIVSGLSLYDLIIHLCVHIDKHFVGDHIQMKCFNDIVNIFRIFKNQIKWDSFIVNCKHHSCESLVFKYLIITNEFYQIDLPNYILSKYTICVTENDRIQFINFLHCKYPKKYHTKTHIENIANSINIKHKIQYLIELAFPSKSFMIKKYSIKHPIIYYIYYPYRLWIGIKGAVVLMLKK